MKNITLTLDEETYRLACIRAAELDTSVSALVQSYLRHLVNIEISGIARKGSDVEKAIELRHRELDEVMTDFAARGVGLRSSDDLTRDELYDEATNSPNTLC